MTKNQMARIWDCAQLIINSAGTNKFVKDQAERIKGILDFEASKMMGRKGKSKKKES